MQVEQIAALLEASFEGDGTLAIEAANDVSLAGPTEIAFVEGAKAAHTAASSRAGCLLAPQDLEIPAGRTVIRVAKPRNAFARILRRLHPEPKPLAGIHPTAVVAASAAIGPDVSIGPHVVIGESASIGAGTVISAGVAIGERSKLGSGCRVYPQVVIYPNVTVGDRAILHAGCVLGSDGFGFILEAGRFEKFPQIGSVEIGNDVEIGANACVDRGALGATILGDGVKLDNMVHIGHNCRLGSHVVIAAQTGLSGGVVVEDYVVMGGQVGISEKARIETRAVVGAQCGILPYKILEAGQTFWGTPARPHREHLQRLALVNRLPKVFDEMESLRTRLEALEGALAGDVRPGEPIE
jgi:UDP-3-O-[3-hydroxymyristoyl] glucosamine N-acyltransferase